MGNDTEVHRLDQVLVLGKNSQSKVQTPTVLVPYYAWENREAGYMQVWLRTAEDRRLYSV
ncbi:hypothetical protein [Paenibacillus sp. PAMC21692]|uniref:hypothetical protein n=1 Tax=Paenibacillus sp. PAMC21692 TaxID=2762320 RepID=UPI0037CC41D8